MKAHRVNSVFQVRHVRDGSIIRLPNAVEPGLCFDMRYDKEKGIITGTLVAYQPVEVIQI
jgi:hypothetical protein